MSKATGYSLWLIPDSKNCELLGKIISQASQTYGTPSFEPHITLIGELAISDRASVIAKTEKLVTKLSELHANLNSVNQTDHFFMSLFLTAEQENNLNIANTHAREIFMRQGDPKFFPHLSLVYGDLSGDAKAEISSKIADILPLSVQLDKLRLIRSEGETRDWYSVREYYLNKGNKGV